MAKWEQLRVPVLPKRHWLHQALHTRLPRCSRHAGRAAPPPPPACTPLLQKEGASPWLLPSSTMFKP